MVQNLVITNIPKDEDVLREILEVLGDYTWSNEGVQNWMNTDTNGIWYNKKYDSYFTGPKVEMTKDHVVKPYWFVIGKVSV